MAYVIALLIFVALSAACWFGSVALYRGTVGGPDPAAFLDCATTAALAVRAAALTSFISFPGGDFADP